MSEETKKKMLLVSAILFKHNVPIEEAKMIGSFIEELQQENQQLKENNMSMQEEMVRTWEKADLYKEVIEEVREYVDNIVPCIHDEELLDEVLQILDKVKEN